MFNHLTKPIMKRNKCIMLLMVFLAAVLTGCGSSEEQLENLTSATDYSTGEYQDERQKLIQNAWECIGLVNTETNETDITVRNSIQLKFYADGTYTFSNGVVDHHGNYKTEGSAIHILSMGGTKEWSQFLYYFENIKTFQIVSKQLRLYVSSTSYLLFEPMP